MKDTIKKKGGIRKNYSHKVADAKKVTRREEAGARQDLRDRRSNREQIARLDAGGFVAKKERARLRGAI